MTQRMERVRRGTVASEHIVQLFDEEDSLAREVGAFLADGARAGDSLLAVVKPAHWSAIAATLEASGVDVEALGRESRLTVLDAKATLDALTRQGEPVRALFDEVVGTVVRRLTVRPLRVYGEMVELLAAEANFDGAERLEAFWNELAATCSFLLLCGYCSVHFGSEASGNALHRICRAHTRTVSHEADHLGSWLLQANAHRQPA